MAQLIKVIKLEDVTSHRHAQYFISLKNLADGYVVEVCWGGATGKKRKEAYYREDLRSASDKFDALVRLKTDSERKRKRIYAESMSNQLCLPNVGVRSRNRS
ncbi:MAG: hypothetical protein PHN92_05620 [Geobacter sp.]|nr:hypothetical protein [Geobacter sp.]